MSLSSGERHGLLPGEVREIALESRLALTDEELDGAVRYINDFLDMLDRFRELELKDVEPFSFAEAIECPLREDDLVPFPNRDEILRESAHVEQDYFKVPRIIEAGDETAHTNAGAKASCLSEE